MHITAIPHISSTRVYNSVTHSKSKALRGEENKKRKNVYTSINLTSLIQVNRNYGKESPVAWFYLFSNEIYSVRDVIVTGLFHVNVCVGVGICICIFSQCLYSVGYVTNLIYKQQVYKIVNLLLPTLVVYMQSAYS